MKVVQQLMSGTSRALVRRSLWRQSPSQRHGGGVLSSPSAHLPLLVCRCRRAVQSLAAAAPQSPRAPPPPPSEAPQRHCGNMKRCPAHGAAPLASWLLPSSTPRARPSPDDRAPRRHRLPRIPRRPLTLGRSPPSAAVWGALRSGPTPRRGTMAVGRSETHRTVRKEGASRSKSLAFRVAPCRRGPGARGSGGEARGTRARTGESSRV
jgi:hypothetical protein